MSVPPVRKVRLDCECGHIQYSAASAQSVSCNRCHAQLRGGDKLGWGGDTGGRVERRIVEEEE